MTRRTSIATAGALAALLALPAAAPALVQVDKGIAGARIGNTPAQVHAALGRPARTATGRNDFGSFRRESYAGGIAVFYQGARRVTSVLTTGRGDRTAGGVGVGSSEAAVRRGVPGVRCETVAGFRSCHTGAFRPGRRVTDFAISRGRVTRITVGVVID